MSYRYKYKRKSVHIEDLIHKKLKHRATENDTSIEQELNDILKKELKND